MNEIITNGWIETFSGERIDPLKPRHEQIHIKDIAHALSLICRFTGHVSVFWSVGQHTLFVEEIALGLAPQNRHVQIKKMALFHDASEAYLCDVARPVKENLPEYQRHESNLEMCIAERFGLLWPWHETVKRADTIALAVEARDLMPSQGRGWNWDVDAWSKCRRFPDHLLAMSPQKVEAVLGQKMKSIMHEDDDALNREGGNHV